MPTLCLGGYFSKKMGLGQIKKWLFHSDLGILKMCFLSKVAHLNNGAKSDVVNKISSFEYVDDCFLREIVKYVCPFKVMQHAAGQIFFF